MHIVQVHIHVKPEKINEFKKACIENAENSLRESGVARFDVLQQSDDPTRFILAEVYRSAEDQAKHKETSHYNKWRDLAEPMMLEARTRTTYINIFPRDEGW